MRMPIELDSEDCAGDAIGSAACIGGDHGDAFDAKHELWGCAASWPAVSSQHPSTLKHLNPCIPHNAGTKATMLYRSIDGSAEHTKRKQVSNMSAQSISKVCKHWYQKTSQIHSNSGSK